MDTILSLQNVTRSFSGFTLGPVDLQVPGGAILGLIGENGAGKTTTLRLILGALRRDGGKVTVFGRDLDREAPHIREDVGVVFDECCFHESMTPHNLDFIFSGILSKLEPKGIPAALPHVAASHEAKIKEFSRGMKMKLSIAVAMAHRPRLLLLDEATSGLDPGGPGRRAGTFAGVRLR